MRARVAAGVTLLLCLWALWDPGTADADPLRHAPTVFVHANLLPMTRKAVLGDHTVVVVGGRIASVGPSSAHGMPPGARVIDCRGAYLMPGLADMHMHLRANWKNGAVWPVSPLKLYLANGVTTIRCFGPLGPSGGGAFALEWRKAIDAGELDGPSILTCGPQLRGHFKKNPEHIVIGQKYRGFDFIKVYAYVTRGDFHTIISTAERLGLYSAGHIPFQVGLDGVLAEGMDEIAHVEELLWELPGLNRQRRFGNEGEWMNDVIRTTFGHLSGWLELSPSERERKIEERVLAITDKLKGRSIPFCTTMVIDDVIVEKLFHRERFIGKPENRFMPAGYLESVAQGREKHQLQFSGGRAFAPLKYRLDQRFLAALKNIGCPLMLSTDAGTGTMGIVPGFSLHDELAILVENGFSPYEALAAGTVEASKIVKRMNGCDDFGTVTPGKRADLLLLEANPLENIANSRQIRGVMAAGRWYGPEALSAMLENAGGGT